MTQRATKCAAGPIGASCCRLPASRSRRRPGLPGRRPTGDPTCGHRSGEVVVKRPYASGDGLAEGGLEMASPSAAVMIGCVGQIGGRLSDRWSATPGTQAGGKAPTGCRIRAQVRATAPAPPQPPSRRRRRRSRRTAADNPGGAAEGPDRQRLCWRSPAMPPPSIRSSSSPASSASSTRSISQDGALVRKGDLLFTIQQDQYKAQLQQAQAQLQLQQAALLYAKTEVVRYTALLKRDAATQVDVDHWNFERGERGGEHPGGPGAGRDRPAQPGLHRGQGAVRRPDGQAPDRSRATSSAATARRPPWPRSLSSTRSMWSPISARSRRCRSAPTWTSGGSRWPSCTRFRSRPRCRTRPAFRIAARSNTSRRRSIRRPARCWCAASCATPIGPCCPGVFVKIRLPMGKVVQSALLVPDRALQEDQGGRYLLVSERRTTSSSSAMSSSAN